MHAKGENERRVVWRVMRDEREILKTGRKFPVEKSKNRTFPQKILAAKLKIFKSVQNEGEQ